MLCVTLLAVTYQYGIQSMVNMAELGVCPQAQCSKKVLLSFLPFSQLSLYQSYVVQHLNCIRQNDHIREWTDSTEKGINQSLTPQLLSILGTLLGIKPMMVKKQIKNKILCTQSVQCTARLWSYLTSIQFISQPQRFVIYQLISS